MAELADAIDLGSIARKGVEVRVLSSAPGAVGARGLAGRRLLCKEKIVGSNPTGSTSHPSGWIVGLVQRLSGKSLREKGIGVAESAGVVQW